MVLNIWSLDRFVHMTQSSTHTNTHTQTSAHARIHAHAITRWLIFCYTKVLGSASRYTCAIGALLKMIDWPIDWSGYTNPGLVLDCLLVWSWLFLLEFVIACSPVWQSTIYLLYSNNKVSVRLRLQLGRLRSNNIRHYRQTMKIIRYCLEIANNWCWENGVLLPSVEWTKQLNCSLVPQFGPSRLLKAENGTVSILVKCASISSWLSAEKAATSLIVRQNASKRERDGK